MPYKIRKVRNSDCYRVTNAETGKIHAYCTTKEKAERQVRLLYLKAKSKGEKIYSPKRMKKF